MEKLLINRLDETIEIPEVLHFVCNDRAQLLDQLKVLQMVLRKERDKNVNNSLSATSNASSKAQSQPTTSSTKTDLEEKVEKHKKMMAQRRQDRLKQMDTEAQVLSKANKEENKHSESTKVNNREPVYKLETNVTDL